MEKIEENCQINKKGQAFLLQFEGDEYDVRKKLGLDTCHCYYVYPVNNMMHTGMFGILDALVDLELTSK